MSNITGIRQGRVQGFLHHASGQVQHALVLTHGAGANCAAPLLVALATELASHGFHVLRCDLVFRQQRPKGPPSPSNSGHDREGLREAVHFVRELVPGRVYLGGHSYGGRQASMLAAEDQHLADGLLLLSYPLHPPQKPDQMRTSHFGQIQTDALFVHGEKDPFGSLQQLQEALKLIPSRHQLCVIGRAGHDLGGRKRETVLTICDHFLNFGTVTTTP